MRVHISLLLFIFHQRRYALLTDKREQPNHKGNNQPNNHKSHVCNCFLFSELETWLNGQDVSGQSYAPTSVKFLFMPKKFQE
ncbi:MAG: hypothetical protein HY22_07415 [[Candidatus Thermochlorobacteriaceae] bacterium GBChlB]|nr:MAG: hypothetical protein HY22_07415 [[Candidatus Thermochlorobacteriaceae] bacterium GBChlB]